MNQSSQIYSPLMDRYNDPDISKIWDHLNYCRLAVSHWRSEALSFGVTFPMMQEKQLIDLSRRARVLEETTHHELVALLSAYEETLPPSQVWALHLGMTSSDVQDHVEKKLLYSSVRVIVSRLSGLVSVLSNAVHSWRDLPVLGRTHLQPAEPTTLGYRLSQHLEQLYEIMLLLNEVQDEDRWARGAVGTLANISLAMRQARRLLRVDTEEISTLAFGQTYPRTDDLRLMHLLSQLAAVLYKLAQDLRLMSMEPYVIKKQAPGAVGSSAMPGKVNPIGWEKVCGLTRLVPDMTSSIWHMAAGTMLERTLDDSSTRRMVLPQVFMLLAHSLSTATTEMARLKIDPHEARKQVFDNWKSWLPSRYLAILQATRSTGARSELHKRSEQAILSCSTIHEALQLISAACSHVMEEGEVLSLGQASRLAFLVWERANEAQDQVKEGNKR